MDADSLKNITNPLPTKAQGMAKPGQDIYIKTADGKTIKSKAGNIINSTDTTTFKNSDGTSVTYAKSSPVQISKRTNELFRKRGTKHSFGYPLKILFSVFKDGNYNFYIGGDRDIPDQIYSISYTSGTIYSAEITNTGKTVDDWIVTIKWIDNDKTTPLDNYPYTDEGFVPYNIAIITPQEIKEYEHPSFEFLLHLKYGSLISYFDSYSLQFNISGWQQITSEIQIDNISYIASDPPIDPLGIYIPTEHKEWGENGYNDEFTIYSNYSVPTDPNNISHVTIATLPDSLGNITSTDSFSIRSEWFTGEVTGALGSVWYTNLDGAIDTIYRGLTNWNYLFESFRVNKNIYSPTVNSFQGHSDFSTGISKEYIARTSPTNIANLGGLNFNAQILNGSGYRKIDFINYGELIDFQLDAEGSYNAITATLAGNIDVGFKLRIQESMSTTLSEINGNISFFEFISNWQSRSAYSVHNNALYQNNVFQWSNSLESNIDDYFIGDMPILCQKKGNTFNFIRENFNKEITTETNYTFNYYFHYDGEVIQLDGTSLNNEGWLDNKGHFLSYFEGTDIIENALYYNQFNADLTAKTISNYPIYKYEIPISGDNQGVMQPYTEEKIKVLSLGIKPEEINDFLYWSSSYYPIKTK